MTLFVQYLRQQEAYNILAALPHGVEGNLLQIVDSDLASESQIEFIRYMVKLAGYPEVVIETGTNKGYFSYIMSEIYPDNIDLYLYTFDTMPQSEDCIKALDNHFDSTGKRIYLNFFLGDSKQTLTQMVDDATTKNIYADINDCGFAWIDGGHDIPTAKSDIDNVMRLGVNYIGIDDCNIPELRTLVTDICTNNDHGFVYTLVENPFPYDQRQAVLLVKNA